MSFWNFRDGVLPSGVTAVTDGAGAVLPSSAGNGSLTLDTGGTAADDLAAIVVNTPINLSGITRIAVRLRDVGADMGADSYNIIGIYDSASLPTAMSGAARLAAQRFTAVDQYSSSVPPTFQRRQFWFRGADAGNPIYWWRHDAQDWVTTPFESSNTGIERDSFYTLVMVIDGVSSPKRCRLEIYGRTDTADGQRQGNWMIEGTTWVEINNGNGSIAAITNNAYVVIGDLVNDKAAGRDVQYIFDWIEVAQWDRADTAQWCITNDSPDANFPFPYNLHSRFNPSPGQMNLWSTVERYNTLGSDSISRGANTWAKDGRVYDDTAYTGYYYIIYQIRDAGDTVSDLWMARSAVWPPVWADHTELFSSLAAKDEFPQLLREPGGGRWYINYGEETTFPSNAWRILQRYTDDTDPLTAIWSAAIEKLIGQPGQWDQSGCSGPYIQWYEGEWATATIIMWYYGYNGSNWQMHFAISETGIEGTFTRASIGPTVPALTSAITTVNGNQASTRNLAVADGSVLNIGDPLITYEGQLNAILDISGNTLELETKLSLNDGRRVDHLCHDSLLLRYMIRLDSTTWWAPGTAFGLSGGFEFAWGWLGTGSSDPRAATWRPLRVNDSQMQATVPMYGVPFTQDTVTERWESVENPGSVEGEISPIVSVSSNVALESKTAVSVSVGVF